MEIKPIHSAEDHMLALKEIESLMSARKGSPEGGRLEILSTLVDDWERRNHEVLVG